MTFPTAADTQTTADEANILLVDDKPENLQSLEVALENIPATLVKASSGEDALRCLLHRNFAVILLDVRMPGMDGLETAQMIRQREQSQKTPIIFLTAYGDDDTRVSRGYSLGAVDYIQKPVNARILAAKVGVFLDLYLRNKKQKESEHSAALARERQHLEGMSARPETAVTAGTFGAGALRDAVPERFNQLADAYLDLINSSLESRAYKTNSADAESSAAALRLLSQELGFLNAGPRDVIDLHIASLARANESNSIQKAAALAEESRLLLIELMGHLVSHYRNHAPMFGKVGHE